MTNEEMNRTIAEMMGYRTETENGSVWCIDGPSGEPYDPAIIVAQAIEATEKYCDDTESHLQIDRFTDTWRVILWGVPAHIVQSGNEGLALTICQVLVQAIKAIEKQNRVTP